MTKALAPHDSLVGCLHLGQGLVFCPWRLAGPLSNLDPEPFPPQTGFLLP